MQKIRQKASQMKEINLFGVKVSQNDKILISQNDLEKVRRICDSLTLEISQAGFDKIVKDNNLTEA